MPHLSATVLTSPRPRPTLERTLRSLRAAGVPDIHVHHDRVGAGHFLAYMAALRAALEHEPDADAYFIVEDDVVFCRGLHAYLQRALWPGPAERIALCSPYCPEAYRRRRHGWNDRQSHRGLYLAGSQAWVFPRHAARSIVNDLSGMATTRNADYEIGKWALERRLSVWHHAPSLAEHIGVGNSALGDPIDSPLRHAADFPGEDFDAADFRPAGGAESGRATK